MRINTEELRNITKIVMPAVKSDSLEEELGAIVFDGTYMLSYNDKVAISYPLPESAGELACGVSGDDFEHALKGIRTKDVTLEVQENVLVISGGKTVIEIPLMNEDKLLELHDSIGIVEAEKNLKPLPKDFLHGLGLCNNVATNNMNNLQGLYTIRVTKDLLYASDGFRVCRYNLSDKMPSTYIAKPFVEDVIKFTPVEYYFTDAWLYFGNIDGGMHCCRTMPIDSFPLTMDKLLDCAEDADYFTFPTDILDELEAASFFSEGKDAREKVASVSINDLGLAVIESSGTRGRVTTEAQIEDYKGEEVTFNVSPIFLRMMIAEEGKFAVTPKFLHMTTGPFVQIVSLR